MGIIIFVLIIWLSFKILEWAFPSSSDSNNDKETSNHDNVAIDSNSNEEFLIEAIIMITKSGSSI